MNRKLLFSALVLLTLTLVLSISFSATLAQDATPRGGTIVINESPRAAWVRNFNPYAPDPAPPTRHLVYESLTLFNPVEGGAATHWLATDYSYSDDLLALTFNLREGVTWSDGEPFTADDVVFTFDLIKEFPAMDRGAMLQFTDSAEKVDDLTVTFHLNQVYTQADTIIGFNMMPLPEHIWSEIEDPVTFENPDPVSTGPFPVVSVFNEQVFELCRNENYWKTDEGGNSLPYVDCLRYPLYTSNDSVNLALINGEVDWAGNFVPDIETTFVSADPEHGYYFWPGGGTIQLYTNTTKAPFDDVNFRRVLSMAIDYDSVTNIGMYGYTVPASPTGLGPKHESWVSQEAVDAAAEMSLGVYDPEAAMAALDEAGYVDANGDGWRDLPDGSPIEFKVQVVNGWTDWVTSVQIMSQNFQDVGLNATIETPDFGVWLNNLQTGTYDVSIGWSTSGRTPWDFYRNILDSTLIGTDGLANAQLWARWTSEETDELLNSFVATADETDQHDIINQLQMTFVENVVAIPLFPGPTWYEYNTTRIAGFPTPDEYFAQGSPWEEQARLIVVNRLHCVDDTSCGQ